MPLDGADKDPEVWPGGLSRSFPGIAHAEAGAGAKPFVQRSPRSIRLFNAEWEQIKKADIDIDISPRTFARNAALTAVAVEHAERQIEEHQGSANACPAYREWVRADSGSSEKDEGA